MELLDEHILCKELNLNPIELQELPLWKVEGHLFIIDTIGKKGQLESVN